MESDEDLRGLVLQLVRSCAAFVATHGSELPEELSARAILPPLAMSPLVREEARRVAGQCARSVAPPLLMGLALLGAVSAVTSASEYWMV